MAQQVSFKNYGGPAPENYERYFVPVIPAPLAADLIETAVLLPGEHVVDVACGTGVVTRLASERVGASGRVVGVDLNLGMLEVARAIPAPPGASIEWREASAEALPMPDESFDVVLCQLGLMFVADRPAALREMRRVLSSGGRVAINVPGAMPRLMATMGDALARHVKPDLAGFAAAVYSLHDPLELERLLRDAGFDDVDVQSSTKTLRLPPPEDFLWQSIYATPLGTVVAEADADRREALEREVVDRWQEFVEDGALVLQLPLVLGTARV